MRSVIRGHLPRNLTLPDQRYLIVSLLGRVIQLLIHVVIHQVARSTYTSVGRSVTSPAQATHIHEHLIVSPPSRHPHVLSEHRLRPAPTRNRYLAAGASQPHCIAPGVATSVSASLPPVSQSCRRQYR